MPKKACIEYYSIVTEPCGKIIEFSNEQANPFSFAPAKGSKVEDQFPFLFGLYPMQDQQMVLEHISFDSFEGNIVLHNELEQVNICFYKNPENETQWQKLIQKHNQEKLIKHLEMKTDNLPLPGNVLHSLGFMSFVKVDSNYHLAGNIPDWFKLQFPNYNYSNDIFDLTDLFPFLEVFLPEAEQLFGMRSEGKIASGLWTEVSATNQEIILQATALVEKEKHLILLEPISERNPNKHKDLQRSRELSLAHNQLIKTEDALRDILKYREQFISIFSHDIKGPLAGTYALMNLLSTDEGFMKAFEPQHEHIFNVISKGLKDLYDYSEKLYEWSNINFGQPNLEIANIDLNYLMKQIMLSLENKVKAKNIAVEIQITEQLFVKADEVFFKSALFNILTNAIKFSELLGKITISATEEEGYSLIRIQDEGLGMSEEEKKSLFNFDEKKSKTGTSGEKGTGIGLTIVKKIMDMHKAIIEVESEVGKGTSIIIKLPN